MQKVARGQKSFRHQHQDQHQASRWLNAEESLEFLHLQYNLFHLLIGRLELSDQDQHHLPCVVVGVFSIHQWNQVTDSFEESSKTLKKAQ